MKYSLIIAAAGDENAGSVIDVQCASLDVISYAAKMALREIEGSDSLFSVELSDIVSLTADSGTVADVLRARLSKLRKAAKAAE